MAQAAARARETNHPPDVLIIGAGFAGLYQLLDVRDRLGLRATVLEAGHDVGGTWYWNRYPGARCDSESHSYCYTFNEALYRDWTWSERYPGHAEIRRYLGHVADRFDLRRDIRFKTRVTRCTWDERAALWRVQTDGGDTHTARFLITAVGCLSTANVPAIPGLDRFAGRWFHTGEWPHDDVDFTGLRVGQIGTGSTGIQSVPVIAQTARALTVFQRTANYSVPARNAPLTRDEIARHKATFADIRAMMQSTPNGHSFPIQPRDVADVSAAERERLYEAAWAKGGLEFRATFRDLTMNKAANDTAADFIRRKIRATVRDPATAALLTDFDHPYAAKRPPIDTQYFETFNAPHVSLVDVRADPIVEITATGVRLRSGRRFDLDVIVFATGFDAMTGPLLKLDITGAGGARLADVWAAGPRTTLGVQVAGFPNLFTITGPQSPSVLTNMPVAIEQHVTWISDALAHLRTRGADLMTTTDDAMSAWGRDVEAAASATLLPGVSHSWYLGANVPGKPRVFMPYAGGMARYRRIADEVAAAGYRGFSLA
jgi:cation diffusion facilitator CzcD-associated flavoprotein CzcO